MTKYRIAIIGGCTVLDQWMHAADLFENFKRLISEPVILDIELRPEQAIDKKIADVVAQFSTQQEFFPVAVLALGTPHRWVDPQVKVISNGYGWAMLKDFLAHVEEAHAPDTGFAP